MGPLVVVLAACIDPTVYGAVAGDQQPDTAAIQRAIDEATAQGADVCLPAGTFDLDRHGQAGSLEVRGGPVTIRGAGPDTVLAMHGDGGRAAWYALWIHDASRVIVRDLSIVAVATTNTKEQTHLIQIGPAATHVWLDQLRLGPMRRADQRVGEGAGGDCVRLLGERTQLVEDVTITGSDFVDCDRSGLGVQRGVRHVTVAHDSFSGIGDTAIDFEPSADGPVEDLSFVDLAITRPPDAQGAWAMTIDGYGVANPARKVLVTGCDLIGGGIGLLNAEDVVITKNRIRHGPGAYETVHLMRWTSRIVIDHNRIERPATSPAGAVVGITQNNGVVPTHVHVLDNELIQGTDAPVIALDSPSAVELRDNHLTYAGRAAMPAIDVHAIIAQVDDLDVVGNQLDGDGPAHAMVRLVAQRAGIGRVQVAKNQTPAPLGVECVESAGHFRAPIEADRAAVTASATCAAIEERPARAAP